MNMSILEVYDFLFILPLLEISSGFFFLISLIRLKTLLVYLLIRK